MKLSRVWGVGRKRPEPQILEVDDQRRNASHQLSQDRKVEAK